MLSRAPYKCLRCVGMSTDIRVKGHTTTLISMVCLYNAKYGLPAQTLDTC